MVRANLEQNLVCHHCSLPIYGIFQLSFSFVLVVDNYEKQDDYDKDAHGLFNIKNNKVHQLREAHES